METINEGVTQCQSKTGKRISIEDLRVNLRRTFRRMASIGFCAIQRHGSSGLATLQRYIVIMILLTIFDRNKPMPFTPFRGVYDEEKIAFLTNLLFSAIKMTSPNFNLDSVHVSAISKAMKLAYVKKCEQAGLTYLDGKLEKVDSNREVELRMDDFVAELGRLPSEEEFEKSREKIEGLLEVLMPFYGDGLYGSYFRGTGGKPYKKETLLYAYDLDALDNDPILQALMTASVMEEIRQIIRQTQERREP